MFLARRMVHCLDSRRPDRAECGCGARVPRAVRGGLVELVVFAIFIVAVAVI
jgi:hypothetical protein